MFRKSSFSAMILVGAAVSLVVSPCHASTQTINTDAANLLNGSLNYTITLDSGSLASGDGFAVYDFQGYVAPAAAQAPAAATSNPQFTLQITKNGFASGTPDYSGAGITYLYEGPSSSDVSAAYDLTLLTTSQMSSMAQSIAADALAEDDPLSSGTIPKSILNDSGPSVAVGAPLPSAAASGLVLFALVLVRRTLRRRRLNQIDLAR